MNPTVPLGAKRFRKRTNRLTDIAVILGSLALGSSIGGCTHFAGPGAGMFNWWGEKPSAPQGAPACRVDMYNSTKEKVGQVSVPLSEPATLSQILKRSGAYSRFGRVEAELIRDKDRMKAKFTYGKLEELSDYAVYPGDRVIVVEDTSTFMDDTLDSLGGRMLRRFAKP